MSTRIFPLLAFAIWCFVCRNWYVCHIKERCGNLVEMSKIGSEPAAAVEAPAIPAPDPEPKPVPEPVPEPPAATPPPASRPAVSDSPVEELPDKVVIHYDYNKLDKVVSASVDKYLDRLADQLKTSGKKVTLIGHTDAVGDGQTNILVSERRAKNIRDLLKEKGVPNSQIKTIGKGESQPVGNNDKPEGRQKNRRVEVFLEN